MSLCTWSWLNWPEGAHGADEPVSHLPSERDSAAVATRAMEAAVQALNASRHVTVTSTAHPGAALPVLLEEARHVSRSKPGRKPGEAPAVRIWRVRPGTDDRPRLAKAHGARFLASYRLAIANMRSAVLNMF